ncbi:MAG: tRNA lysidine(34) synthetase TilS, partial [Clostridia bacterium]|nr:tRNA lysidine(34) synthetase TilS [Clostridia bacterium]
MINTVIEAIEQYNMLKNVKTVTVALSGGADSVALLLAMLQLRSRYGITVKAAHLNHNLRGEESDRDEQFVRSLCEQYKVELAVKSVDVKNLAQSTKQSVELAARAARYEFFACCDGVVATAHTADDNIETVLLNLVRGTGLEGICGIPPVREGFIRPLIMCTRAQIEQFCKE